GAALRGDKHALAIATKQHQTAFPMAHRAARVDLPGASVNGYPSLDVLDGAAPPHAQPTAAGFAPRQQAMAVVFLRAAMIDEAVYGFVGDNTVPGLGLELAGDFGGGPTRTEPNERVAPPGRLAGRV